MKITQGSATIKDHGLVACIQFFYCIQITFIFVSLVLNTVQPAVMDFIYQELALDGAAARHPRTMERMNLIFLGNEDLVTDLRILNPGRPRNSFDPFFEEMTKVHLIKVLFSLAK